jgi:hypothetical protein
VGELFLHLHAGLLLDGAAILQQLDQRAGLTDVLEVRRHHRVERLLHQFLDVAEALDHERGLLVVNVDDHRKRQGRLERILGDERDFAQVFIELVRACLPLRIHFKDEVGGGHRSDLARIRVERVFARQERLAPHTALPLVTSSPWRYSLPERSSPVSPV